LTRHKFGLWTLPMGCSGAVLGLYGNCARADKITSRVPFALKVKRSPWISAVVFVFLAWLVISLPVILAQEKERPSVNPAPSMHLFQPPSQFKNLFWDFRVVVSWYSRANSSILCSSSLGGSRPLHITGLVPESTAAVYPAVVSIESLRPRSLSE
jgi:hypothetical protein